MELKLLAYIEYSKLEIINPLCGIRLLIPDEDSMHRMKSSISKFFIF